MTLRIYDTLTREKREFTPLVPGVVGMYVCGPTVYDDCHIGHMMGPVTFDAIARWMIQRGFRVKFVINITDIDDKIINRARDTGESWDSIAERYTQQYFEFLRELRVETVTDNPRCTQYVPQMVEFIAELVATDQAYETSDGVYFDVLKHEGYGKLSGRRVEDMRAVIGVEAGSELRHPADFALWKKAKPGEPSWPSPWGAGRPGWHIECSVMSRELLGTEFDIHGGGDDLKFPHHENEIAQSEAHGDGNAMRWMHNGLIQFGGRKIAKSDPRMKDPEFSRQFQARWLIDKFGPQAVRFFLLRSPYRRPVDFEPETLEGARTGLVRLVKQLGELARESDRLSLDEILALDLPADLAAARERFCAAMDDDFNTGEAVAELFTIAAEARRLEGAEREAALRLLRDLGRLLGLFHAGDVDSLLSAGHSADERLGAVLEALLAVRADARSRKDFATSDGVRDRLAKLGVAIEDAGGQSRWTTTQALPADATRQAVELALELRREARARKDFASSDAIRDRLAEAGVSVLDGAQGSAWEFA